MYRVEKKKRHSGILIFLLFAFAFAIGLGIGYGGIKLGLWGSEENKESESVIPQKMTSREPEERPVPNQPASATTTLPQDMKKTQEGMFYVAAEDGVVCVFTLEEDGTRRFSHTLSIPLEALRPEDQKLLKEGIHLHSRQALLEFTEDFCS